MFYLIAIMGDGADTDAATVYPTLGPAAAMEDGALAFSAGDLAQAQSYCAAPLATLGGGWYLTGGEIRQWREKGQTLREVRLSYTQNNGTATLELSTLTPRAYLYTLPGRGLLPTVNQDHMMLGQKAVCMSDGSTTHLHVTRGEAVYQIESALGLDPTVAAAGLAIIAE